MADLDRPDEATAFPKPPDNGEGEQPQSPPAEPVVETQRTEKEVDLEEPKDTAEFLKIERTKPGNEQLVMIRLLATINAQLSTIIKQNDRLVKAAEAK